MRNTAHFSILAGDQRKSEKQVEWERRRRSRNKKELKRTGAARFYFCSPTKFYRPRFFLFLSFSFSSFKPAKTMPALAQTARSALATQ